MCIENPKKMWHEETFHLYKEDTSWKLEKVKISIVIEFNISVIIV